MSSVFVGITIDKKTHDKIEAKRGDLPRSYVYQKIIKCGIENGGLKFK